MSRKLPRLAIAYDFDGTLAPGNMQEREFIPAIGMTKDEFWDENKALCKEHQADSILMYMKLMLDKAQAKQKPVRREDIMAYGKTLPFFKGVLPNGGDPGWFKRINEFGDKSKVKVQHFIISAGIKEMIQGCKIAKEFHRIYASNYYYDENGVAKWPALSVNYTSKTQFLFRINKGFLDVHDNDSINTYIPAENREIPFTNIIYIGDGDTDIPSFRVVRERGGNSIVVYPPKTPRAKNKVQHLLDENRVNFRAVADYSDGKELDMIVKAIIDSVAANAWTRKLEGRSDPTR